MSNQELINAGTKTMDETDQAIERSKQVSHIILTPSLLLDFVLTYFKMQVVHQTIEVGTQTAATLKGQVSLICIEYVNMKGKSDR